MFIFFYHFKFSNFVELLNMFYYVNFKPTSITFYYYHVDINISIMHIIQNKIILFLNWKYNFFLFMSVLFLKKGYIRVIQCFIKYKIEDNLLAMVV